MRMSISNIAWDISEDEQIVPLLRQFGIDAIDIAPGKYFPDPKAVTSADIAKVRTWWADRRIEVVGMQALLFGTTGLNLFGSKEVQAAMLDHLDAVCRIGSGLSAPRLVFGSPKNRDRSALSDEAARRSAVPFFRRLGDIAGRYGVVVCLEPNPLRYGANFMTNSAETAVIVSEVAHPAVRMQLDTGALTINGEDPSRVIADYASLIGHVHASEPDLIPLGDGKTDHAKIATILMKRLPDQVVSIEMRAAENEPHLDAITRALDVAIAHYRDSSRQGGPA